MTSSSSSRSISLPYLTLESCSSSFCRVYAHLHVSVHSRVCLHRMLTHTQVCSNAIFYHVEACNLFNPCSSVCLSSYIATDSLLDRPHPSFDVGSGVHICHCVIGYVQTRHCSAQKIGPSDAVPIELSNESACNIGRNRDLAAYAHPLADCEPTTSITMPESSVHISRWL